jgi:apolipoprotein N-acyltransferase
VRAAAVLEHRVPLLSRTTPAVRFGAWVEHGMVAVAAVAALVGIGVGYRRRPRRATRTRHEETRQT